MLRFMVIFKACNTLKCACECHVWGCVLCKMRDVAHRVVSHKTDQLSWLENNPICNSWQHLNGILKNYLSLIESSQSYEREGGTSWIVSQPLSKVWSNISTSSVEQHWFLLLQTKWFPTFLLDLPKEPSLINSGVPPVIVPNVTIKN